MESFEQLYYESENFWNDEALDDENNKKRIEETTNLIPLGVQNLLDAGCGNGILIKHIQKNRPEITTLGLDRSHAAIKHVPGDKLISEIDQIPLMNESFDCVCCTEVLEHLSIEAYQKCLSELARISKKNIILSVPFNEDLSENMTKCPSCLSVFNANLHLRSYTEQAFAEILLKNNYKLIEYKLIGQYENFKYHQIYKKIFFPSQTLKWNSPICPICGFNEVRSPGMTDTAKRSKPKNAEASSLIQILKKAPKAFWPKEKKYYWIIGLFVKD